MALAGPHVWPLFVCYPSTYSFIFSSGVFKYQSLHWTWRVLLNGRVYLQSSPFPLSQFIKLTWWDTVAPQLISVVSPAYQVIVWKHVSINKKIFTLFLSLLCLCLILILTQLLLLALRTILVLLSRARHCAALHLDILPIVIPISVMASPQYNGKFFNSSNILRHYEWLLRC